MRLANKVAIVTGGGSGIGKAIVQVSLAIPIGRMGRAEEVAACAAFLASSDADYVVAQTYGVDGGNWMA